GVFDHSGNAFSAAVTAASTSLASLSGTWEYGLPVAGSILSRYFPPIGSANLPSMKFWICGDSVRTVEFKRSTCLRQASGVAGASSPNLPSCKARPSRARPYGLWALDIQQQDTAS